MPATTVADVIVVGRGMFGTAAARHLAERGLAVVAIGPVSVDPDVATQTSPGEPNRVFSSHNDEARLTRLQDRDARWAPVTEQAIAGYAAIEQASGIKFHRGVGCLIASRPGGDERNADPIAHLQERDLDHEFFAPGDRGWSDQWPKIDFPDTHAVAFEPAPAGYIRPKQLIAAQEFLTVASGGSIIDDVVVGITRTSPGFEATLSSGITIATKQVVVAAGAFTNFNGLLEAPVELELKTEVIILGEVAPEDAADLGRYPTVKYLNDGDDLDAIYMTPAVNYPDGRHCIKMGANVRLDTHPTSLEAVQDWFGTDTDRDYLDLLAPALQALWPNVAFRSFQTRPCIVTYTPDRFPLVREIEPGLVVATAGNGGGAKASDAWGAMAADLIAP